MHAMTRSHRDLPAAGPASPPEEPTDAELIQRTLAGDRSSFEGVVRRYQDRAYWAAANLVGDPEEAKDIAQDAFLRAYRALARFDFRMSFYTWLYRIVVNLSIDHLRKRSRLRPVALDELDAGLADDVEQTRPDGGMERREAMTQVRAVLDRLPEKYRTVMILRELNGMSCKEIAAIVRSTHSTVRWRLHMARKMFKNQWERMERVRTKKQARARSRE